MGGQNRTLFTAFLFGLGDIPYLLPGFIQNDFYLIKRADARVFLPDLSNPFADLGRNQNMTLALAEDQHASAVCCLNRPGIDRQVLPDLQPTGRGQCQGVRRWLEQRFQFGIFRHIFFSVDARSITVKE